LITTLDQLGRSTQNMLNFAEELRGKGAALRLLNLGEETWTGPDGSMVFTVMAALAQMVLDVKMERIGDSVSRVRAAGLDLGVAGRRSRIGSSGALYT
jgi:DNA invertase Pin-like site-specific DNA recombinase